VEGAAGGLLCALFVADRLQGREPVPPPQTTALGGLLTHLKRNADDYQPSNITFSHITPWDGTRLKKREKYEAMAERALRDLAAWQSQRSALVA
jgi:methylenetetrahydrofolate--tRNA-(uracil-5-)-methyltransferase